MKTHPCGLITRCYTTSIGNLLHVCLLVVVLGLVPSAFGAAGGLDPTFNGSGKVLIPFRGNITNDLVTHSALQADGKTVVVGTSSSAEPDKFAVARFTTSGLPDATFSGDGRVLTAVGTNFSGETGYAQANAVAIQSDGKIVVAGKAYVGGNSVFTVLRYHTDGSLDSGFDGDGIVTSGFTGGTDGVTAMAIQSDGKILVTGRVNDGTYNVISIVRYLSNGALDTSFDGDGKAFLSGDAVPRGLAVLSTGRILVCSSSYNYGIGSPETRVARLLSTGSLDTSFGSSGGALLVGPEAINNSLKVQADGKILMLGRGGSVNRLLATGETDVSFVFAGFFGLSDFNAGTLALQSDAKILVSGYAYQNGQYVFVLGRYLASGSLDTSFDGDGLAFAKVGANAESASGITVQSDAKIVVAGGAGYDFGVARFNTNGALDTAFGSGGSTLCDFSTFLPSYGRATVIQPDEKILVVGSVLYGGNNDVAVLRTKPDGTLDTSFGSGGSLRIPIGGDNDYGTAVALQPDGKILVAGYSFNGSNYDFLLLRLNANGSLDNTFDGDGKITTPVGIDNDITTCIGLQSDGKILVGGYAFQAGNNDFAVVRYNTNGTLDTSFNATGKVTTTFGSGDERGFAMVIQSDGKIVVAGTYNNGSNEDFAVLRYNTSGTLDTTFNSTGKASTGFGAGHDNALAVTLQADGKIVVAGQSDMGGTGYDFSVARYNTNGSLDTTFDGDGKRTTDMATGNDGATAVAVQVDGKIIAAGYGFNGLNNFALVRYNTNGALDTGFDGDGSLTTDFQSTEDRGYAIALRGDGKILAVGESNPYGTYQMALARYDSGLIPDIVVEQPVGTGLVSGTGTINWGDTIIAVGSSRTFTVRNTGQVPLTGISVSATGAQAAEFIITQPALTTLAAGGSTTFSVNFIPASGGTRSATLNIGSNDPDETPFLIAVTGNGIAAPVPVEAEIAVFAGPSAADPELTDGQAQAFNFGSTFRGVPMTRTFTITNSGLASLAVSGVTLPPGYSIVDMPAQIAPGTASLARLRMDAVTDGTYSGTITILCNDLNESSFDFPVSGTVGQVQAGSLDPSFSDDGKIIIAGPTDPNYSPTSAKTVLRQSDGKILVGGAFGLNNSNSMFVVLRYNQDMTLDATFDGDGIAGIELSAGYSGAAAGGMALQADGKIVLVGTASTVETATYFSVARLNPDGSPDLSFDGDGKLTTSFAGSSGAQAVAIQADGKIVVVGKASIGSNDDLAVVRYLPNGALDTTFGSGGKVTTPIGSSSDWGRAVALQSDGKIVVAGSAYIPIDGQSSGWDFGIVRYTTNGSLDASFSGDGKATIDFGNGTGLGDDIANALVIQSDGKIVLAGEGYSIAASQKVFALARLTTGGVLDTTFDGDGKVMTLVGTYTGSNNSIANEVKIQADGKIVAAGLAYNSGAEKDFGLARYNANGSLDTVFSGDGKQTTHFGVGYDTAYSLLVQPDGKILAVGDVTVAGSSYEDVGIARYNSNGTLDTTLDGDGLLTTDASLKRIGKSPHDALMLPDGKILVSYGGDVSRYDSQGLIDASFGSGGVATTSVVTAYSWGKAAIARDASGRIVKTGVSTSGGRALLSVSRFLENGLPDTSFDGDGTALVDVDAATGTSGDQYASAVAIQTDGRIVVAGQVRYGAYTGNYNNLDSFVVRLNTGGTLDTTFNGTGKRILQLNSSSESLYDLAIQSDGKIVVAGTIGSYPSNESFAMRFNANGTSDATFDGDGIWTVNLGGSDFFSSIALQGDGKILLAGGVSNNFSVVRLNLNGSLDNTFDTDGKVAIDFNSSTDYSRDMILLPDGAVVIAGQAYTGSGYDLAVAKLDANGAIDTSFGTNGRMTVNFPPSSSTDDVVAIGLVPDGKLLMVGRTYSAPLYTQSATFVRIEGGLRPEIDVEETLSGLRLDGVVFPFGNVLLPGVDSRTFTIRNTGNLDLTDIGTSVSGIGAAAYTVSAPSAVSLAPGASTTFTVQFAPTDAVNYVAELIITSNDTDESLFNIPLTGAGTTLPPIAPPSALTYSSNPAVYIKDAAIPGNTPSSGGGAVVSYSVSPALPAGLALNTDTGIITGTPTVVAATASYTVTATNTGGSTTVSLSITVITSPLVTTPTSATVTANTAILGGTVTSDGGAAITTRGVVYALTSANANPQIGGTGVVNITTTGTTGIFTVNATSLSPSAAYTFAAYATNSVGTSYSSTGSFTTAPATTADFRQTWYGTSDNTGNAADAADPYGTGVPNLAVFAFFGPTQDPATAKASDLPQAQLSGGNLTYSFTEPAGVSGITYGAEWSTTLQSGSWQPVTDTGTPPQHTFAAPLGTNSKLYLRLRVTAP